jgi:hypothetical protein
MLRSVSDGFHPMAFTWKLTPIYTGLPAIYCITFFLVFTILQH